MSSSFFYILYLQIWFIYNEINQCVASAGLADGSFSLGFKVDLASDVAIAQTASVSSSIAANIHASGDSGVGGGAIADNLPVDGTTLVAGEMSFLGAVGFDGDLAVDENVFVNVESAFLDIDGAEIMFLYGD